MLYHLFDGFYMVTKFEMPKIKDLKLTTFTFDLTCDHLNNPKSYIHWYLKHCQKIVPYVKFYQKQIEYYNRTAYDILEKEIRLILPTYNNNKRSKRFIGILLGSLASGVIGLALEGISSFLHHKRYKALTKAVNVMKEKADLQHKRVYRLEDTMIMYGKYNLEMDLINTVHHMQNLTSWKEKMFVGKMTEWVQKELAKSKNEYSYSVDTILFLTTVREKYVKMYERFIAELK